jgi:hypothetical protein
MNIPFILLWVLIFVGVIVLTYASLRNIEQVNDSKGVYTLDLNTGSCYPNQNIINLPEASGKCCVINGIPTTQQPFYYKDYNLNFIIDITPTLFTEACLSFCVDVDSITGKCKDKVSTSSGSLEIPQYTACLEALAPPVNCIDPSKALAQKNKVPYYAITEYVSGTDGNCSQTTDC